MMSRRMLRLATTLGLAAAVAACGHIHNPFPSGGHGHGHGGGKSKYTGTGERISLLAPGDELKVSDALKGQDFLPAATRSRSPHWPLPGGTPEQSVEHVDAGHDFQIAWRTQVRTRRQPRLPRHGAADGGGRPHLRHGRRGDGLGASTPSDGRSVWRTDLAMPRSSATAKPSAAASPTPTASSTSAPATASWRRSTPPRGKLIWRTTTDAPIHAAPTVADGRVFAESTRRQPDDLRRRHRRAGLDLPGPDRAGADPGGVQPGGLRRRPGRLLRLGRAGGAAGADNGNELWTDELSRTNRTSALSEIRDIAGRPVIYKGDVFAVSHAGVMAAIDLRTGNVRWTLPVTAITTPWPAGDVVYRQSTLAGKVICASRDNGQIYWIDRPERRRQAKQKDRGDLVGPDPGRQPAGRWSPTRARRWRSIPRPARCERRIKIGSRRAAQPDRGRRHALCRDRGGRADRDPLIGREPPHGAQTRHRRAAERRQVDPVQPAGRAQAGASSTTGRA